MRALIVEHGFNRGALAAARALHAAGWTVDLLTSGTSVTPASASIRHAHVSDYPASGPEGLVEAVRRAVHEGDCELVFPVDETQVLILSEHRDALGALLPFASHAVLTRATDRYEQARLAERAGLAPPRTTLGTETDFGAARGVVVLKSRSPVVREVDGGWSRIETQILEPEAAAELVAGFTGQGIETVVQERLPGGLASLTVLLTGDGRLIAQEQQAAARIWPADAGASARAETVPVDPGLSRRVVAFAESLEWTGLAQLQFIVDDAGVPHVIDFNPRFYGSLSLAVAAGVNFPALWAAAATGRPHPPMTTARPGVRYHWLGGDLRGSLSRGPRALAGELPATLLWGHAAVHPIWAVRDTRPARRAVSSFTRLWLARR